MEIDKETKARLLLDFHNSISIDGFSLSCELPVRWPVPSGCPSQHKQCSRDPLPHQRRRATQLPCASLSISHLWDIASHAGLPTRVGARVPPPPPPGLWRWQQQTPSVSDSTLSGADGYKDEKVLLEKFGHVVAAYKSLRSEYQDVIRDITQRMARGMQEFTVREVVTKDDFDLYCHYVAGLVGIGLSKLFSGSGLEDPEVAANEEISNHMGLFLQKTNIIRDFLEDYEDVNEDTGARRVFWPREIWSNYTDDLGDFTFGKNETQAVACLNHMVTDALQHLPHCIEYLSAIENEENFRFCAIPQVMAVHTLSLCYANPDVFKGEIRKQLGECRNTKPVKIRKGLYARLMLTAEDIPSVLDIFDEAVESIACRVVPTCPTSDDTQLAVQLVRDTIARGRRCHSPSGKVCEGGLGGRLLAWAAANTEQTAEFVITPLMMLLLANAVLVDVPQALGLGAWPAAPAVEPSSELSKVLHLASTAWGVLLYLSAAAALLAGSSTQRFRSWAVLHLGLCAAEAGAEVLSSASMAAVLTEAAPKILAGATMLVYASRQRMTELTPSHAARPMRIRAAVQ